MPPTTLLYLDDFSLLMHEATVTAVYEEEEGHVLILNATAFYPQGGGQPYDKGVIASGTSTFVVEEVRLAEGVVKHSGRFTQGHMADGELVFCSVDEVRRTLHSRLHSGGHVVDLAVEALGIDWRPGKGYHFPEGPYVEYSGSLADDREGLRKSLEDKCNEIIRQDHKTRIELLDKSDISRVCSFVPDYIREGQRARVVMYGESGIPCGGTHVSTLSEIRSLTIRKIKKHGMQIRVGYDVERKG